MTYAGVCYDGPWEGKSVEMKYSRFPIAILKGSVMDYCPTRECMPAYCDQRFYRWSHPLRKWVFES